MSDLFPPFAPDANEPRKRFKPVPFRVIAPNLVTLIALCLGLTAIRLAYDGRLEPAVYAILAAALLDGVDGRLARLLKGTSRFGAELDSLSDFLSFGAAPALVLHTFVLHHVPGLGWTAALIFAMAMALRLARFNVMLDDPNRPEWQKNFFVGMAAPAGAITSLLPLYLYFLGMPMGPGAAPVVLVYVLGLAFLTVSTIPMYSGKTMGKRVPRNWVLPIFLVTVATFGLIVNFPFEVLTLGTLLFLGSIPFGVRRYRALERADRESTVVKADPPEPTPSL
ncbi:MAG TPA: phosphatidylcholine/phosphatidylserine synthase [Microvirga sp.]|jgi:CDP-diacylglycerol--serine O-phosphatidyltransferase